jgi:hypothetical protein
VSERYWRYQVEKWHDPNLGGVDPAMHGVNDRILMIADAAGAVRGYTILATKRWARDLQVHALELAAGVSWQLVMPPLLRALRGYGSRLPGVRPAIEPLREISLFLGREHPAYAALGPSLAPLHEPPYAWYLRVADLPALIRRIAPALERRLAESPIPGYTGALKIDFYRGGLRLVFEQGRLALAEHWRATAFGPGADAGCPELVFLQLLFGYRDLDELRYAFPYIWVGEAAGMLLRVLFPKAPSWVMPL